MKLKAVFLLLYRFVNLIKWNNWLNNFFYMAKRVNFSQLMMRLMLPFLSLMNDIFFTLFFFIILYFFFYVHWILHFNWFSFTSFNGKLKKSLFFAWFVFYTFTSLSIKFWPLLSSFSLSISVSNWIFTL